jgi:hypothetical protein
MDRVVAEAQAPRRGWEMNFRTGVFTTVVALWCLLAAATAQTGSSLSDMPCSARITSSANPDLIRVAEDDWIEGYLSARNLNGSRTDGDYLFGGGGLAVLEALDGYCASHPAATVATAATEAMRALWRGRNPPKGGVSTWGEGAWSCAGALQATDLDKIERDSWAEGFLAGIKTLTGPLAEAPNNPVNVDDLHTFLALTIGYCREHPPHSFGTAAVMAASAMLHKVMDEAQREQQRNAGPQAPQIPSGDPVIGRGKP